MTQSQTLVDYLCGLLRDGGLRAQFSADPAAALARYGLTDASPRTIYEALVQIGDDQDLGRRNDVLNIPPPPPPAYFPGQPEDGAGARYLDNYVSGLDDAFGPFTGSSDAHGVEHGSDPGGIEPGGIEPGGIEPGGIEPVYDHGPDLDGTDHSPDYHSPDYGADHGGYEADA